MSKGPQLIEIEWEPAAEGEPSAWLHAISEEPETAHYFHDHYVRQDVHDERCAKLIARINELQGQSVDGYKIETYRVVWYAELGQDNGFGTGWGSTTESVPFPTRAAAEAHLKTWPEPRGYAMTRVRQERVAL